MDSIRFISGDRAAITAIGRHFLPFSICLFFVFCFFQFAILQERGRRLPLHRRAFSLRRDANANVSVSDVGFFLKIILASSEQAVAIVQLGQQRAPLVAQQRLRRPDHVVSPFPVLPSFTEFYRVLASRN